RTASLTPTDGAEMSADEPEQGDAAGRARPCRSGSERPWSSPSASIRRGRPRVGSRSPGGRTAPTGVIPARRWCAGPTWLGLGVLAADALATRRCDLERLRAVHGQHHRIERARPADEEAVPL